MNEAVQDDAMGASPTAPDPGSTTVPERDPRPTSVPAASPALPPADAPDPARASAATSPVRRIAVVIGTGGIGGALAQALRAEGAVDEVVTLGRRSTPALDLLDEASIAACAQWLAARGAPELVIDATGILHGPGMAPEKSWRELDPATLAQAFAINAIGPALLMKHFLPLLPRDRRALFATLSAKVGSIGDNRLGGWYAYRASKAALNQLVRTASVELRRSRPQAICVALHPGTVDTGLSAPFAKSGLQVQAPALAAQRLLTVLAGLKAEDSGEFFDYRGERLPW